MTTRGRPGGPRRADVDQCDNVGRHSPACVRRKVLVAVIEFRTSSYCNFGDCVEVGTSPDGSVIVRDSKDDDRSVSLAFTREEWIAFVRGVKAGEFDPA